MNSRVYADQPLSIRPIVEEQGYRDRVCATYHKFLKLFVAALLAMVAIMMFAAAFLSLLPQKADSLLNSDQQPLVKHVPSAQ